MNALFSMPVELSSLVEALDKINSHLALIVGALNRLAPEVPPADSASSAPAGLRDLERTTGPHVVRVRQELENFAEEHNVVVNSEAFMASIADFELQVAEAYGPEAVQELPWNKIAGPIFQRQGNANHKEGARTQGNAKSAPSSAP